MAGAHEIEGWLQHAGWLRRLAGRLAEEGGGDDLAQDAWLAALRGPRSEGPARAWLARVVRNLASNRRRDAGRRHAHEAAVEPGPLGEDPSALAADAEAQRVLAEAVTRLPESLRSAVVLRWYHGLDSAEIGRRLGLPASTVRARLARALAELRAELDRRHGGQRGAWSVAFAALARRAELGAAPAASSLPPLLLGAGGIAAAALVAGGVWITAAGGPGLEHQRGRGSEEHAAAAATLVAPAGATEPAVTERTGTEPEASDAAAREAVVVTRWSGPPFLPVEEPGVELGGRILVDGRAPEWPVELELRSDPELERAQWDRSMVCKLQSITVDPAEGGAFRFGAYPEAWRGRIGARFHTVESSDDGGATLALAAPASDLVLRLRSGPGLTGRFVDERGMPLGVLRFVLELRQSDGPDHVVETNRVFQESRADGRFRIPLHPHYASASATVLVEAGGQGYRRLEVPPFPPRNGHDAGDVVVDAVRTLALQVRDTTGAPIAEAFARVEGPSYSARSEPTDAGGAATLAFVPARAADVRVSAAGYADRVVRVEPGTERIEVALEPLAVLTIRLTGPPMRIAAATELVISAPDTVFAWAEADWDDGPADVQVELGATPWGERLFRDGRNVTAKFGARGDGFFRIAGVAPDVPLAIELRGGQGTTLAARSTLLAPHEWQELVIPID